MTKYIAFLLLISVLLGFTACQSNDTNQTAVKNAANTASSAPKYYQATGVITEIKTETGEVELNHEEIKGVSPAMQTTFQVKNKADLQNLKIGDIVNFTLEDSRGAAQIIEIRNKRK